MPPIEDDVKNTGPDSSPADAADKQPDVDTADSSSADDVTPESSAGESTPESGAEKEPTSEEIQQGFEDAVREAARSDGDATNTKSDKDDGEGEGAGKDKDGEGASATDGTATAATDKADGSDKDGKAAADDNGEDVEPGQRVPYERFKSVIDQRNEVRTQLETVEPRAQEYDKIMGFIQDNGISNQEVVNAFEILALTKSDPAAAREKLAEHMKVFDQFTGHVLPPDLEDEVRQGTLSEQRAQELAQARNRAQFERTQTEHARQQTAQERQRAAERDRGREHAALVKSMQQTVSSVEQKTAQKDPDYQRIQPWVVKEMRLRMADTVPRTPEEAEKVFLEAYQSVKAGLRDMLPRRPESRPSATSTHAGASGAAKPEPQSFMDAVRQAANEST